MNAEHLFEAIGQVDDRLVDAAAVRHVRQVKPARRWLPLAACAAFVVVGIGVVRGLPAATLNSAPATDTTSGAEAAEIFSTQESDDGTADTAGSFKSADVAADDSLLSDAAPESVTDENVIAPQLYTAEKDTVGSGYGAGAVYSVDVTADTLPETARTVADALNTLSIPLTQTDSTGPDTVFLFTADDARLQQLISLLAESGISLAIDDPAESVPAERETNMIALVLHVPEEGKN